MAMSQDYPIYHGNPSRWSFMKGMICFNPLKALHFITSWFISCLYLSIMDGIYIIAPPQLHHLLMSTFRLNFVRYVFLSNLINV
jgi:hypothetical protein